MARYRQSVVEEGVTQREVVRSAWSPAQLVAIVAGLLLVVLGGVALSRSGVHFRDLAATHVMVAGMGFTTLSAIVDLVVGVIVLAGGAFPDTAKGTMAVFGVILLAFGLVVALGPTPFFTSWGYVTANGVFFAVVGGVLLLAAVVSPIFASTRRVTRRDGVASSTTGGTPPAATPPESGGIPPESGGIPLA